MKAKLIGALLLTGCATVQAQSVSVEPTVCVTACGMRGPNVNCAQLGQLESEALSAFERYVDLWERSKMCNALAGWEVQVHVREAVDDSHCGKGGWLLLPHFCASGYTNSTLRVITVVNADWIHGALAHELVHVLDMAFYGKPGHCAWQARGVKKALLSVTGTPDPSPPESDCLLR